MIYTTLNRIRAHRPCTEGWAKLLKSLGKTHADDEPVSYVTILDSNGLDDALRCCRAEPEQHRVWRLFAVACADSVKHLMTDPRSLAAIEAARRHADGLTTDYELAAAGAAAMTAAMAATEDVAWDAGRAASAAATIDAATAASYSWLAARAAFRSAIMDASGVAARSALEAARAASMNELFIVFRNMVSLSGSAD